MKIDLSADITEDSGLTKLILEISGDLLPSFFLEKNYGNDEIELFFVINCVPHNFKKRVKYDIKDKTLSWDIVLNYREVKKLSSSKKKELLAENIINSLDILDDYKQLNLNKKKLKIDMELFFKSIKWIK